MSPCGEDCDKDKEETTNCQLPRHTWTFWIFEVNNVVMGNPLNLAHEFVATVIVNSSNPPSYWKYAKDKPEVITAHGEPAWQRSFQFLAKALTWVRAIESKSAWATGWHFIEQFENGRPRMVINNMLSPVPYSEEEHRRMEQLHRKPVMAEMKLELPKPLFEHLQMVAKRRAQTADQLTKEIIVHWLQSDLIDMIQISGPARSLKGTRAGLGLSVANADVRRRRRR